MPKGKISLQVIKRRLENPGFKKSEKYDIEGKVILISVIKSGKKYFKCFIYRNINRRQKITKELTTLYRSYSKYYISRDELAFIKLLSFIPFFGSGDYCIKIWGKGKRKGLRIFWDGIILPNKKFMRRKKLSGFSGDMALAFNNLSISNRISGSPYLIGDYMRTKQPVGKWHDI